MGSSVMRVEQLSRHMTTYFGDRYDVSIRYVSNKLKPIQRTLLTAQDRDSVFVFSKYAAWGWSGEDMRRLRTRCRAILVDYVDMPMTQMIPDGVDCHIAASFGGIDLQRTWVDREARAGRVISGAMASVLHNYDVALDQVTRGERSDDLTVAYMGTPALMPTSPLARERVDILDAGMPEGFQAALAKIGQYHAHFCVRASEEPDAEWVARPFTKGATAAVCDAVILADRTAPDAERFLGTDYPFFIENAAPDSIDHGLEALRLGFKGAEWRLAQERVRSMAAAFSHGRIAGQLRDAIEACL